MEMLFVFKMKRSYQREFSNDKYDMTKCTETAEAAAQT